MSVPREVFGLFVGILGEMSNGNAVTLVPTQAEITTQEAAALPTLGVSCPHVVTMLDSGRIPHRLVDTRPRVRIADLLVYEEARYAVQLAARDGLTREVQELGFGY